MARIIKRRPSPALVIAVMALFVSLGGVSYGIARNTVGSAQIRNNSIRSRDIRNNDVLSRDIKNGAVFGKDIHRSTISGSRVKKNTLKGANILESTLGIVPSANVANLAGRAGSVNGLTIFPLKRATASASRTAAPEIPLGSTGNFRFYAKCYMESGNVRAREYVALSSGQAIMSTEDEDDLGDSAYLQPSTAETDRELETADAGANAVDSDNDDADFRATDGNTAITGVIGLAAAKQGTPAHGNGPFGAGDVCLFGGSVFG